MFTLEDKSPEEKAIFTLTDQGDDALDDGNIEAYIAYYQKAWEVVPEPKAEWELANGLMACIGEGYYLKKEFDNALNSFKQALECHNGHDNSSVSFRIGQIYYDKGDEEQARLSFQQAWDSSEGRAFDEEDSKYRDFFQKK